MGAHRRLASIDRVLSQLICGGQLAMSMGLGDALLAMSDWPMAMDAELLAACDGILAMGCWQW